MIKPTKILISILTSILAMLISDKCVAQFGFQYNDSIIVLKGTDTLTQPWTGGLNHVQISTIDYDFDGEDDLFIFDRSSNQIRVFLKKYKNGNPYYKFEFGAQSSFPQNMRYRVKLVDYDQDGKKDIFTYTLGGIKVYRNTGNSIDGVQWDLLKDPLITDINGTITSIYVNSDEIPAFVDIDNDGDIDVLTFHSSVGRIEWHKNLSIENYGNSDSLEFVLQEPCWGDFVENSTNNTIDLDSQQSPCGGSNLIQSDIKSLRHAGGTLLALDMNDSGLKDLIIGDVGYNTLTLLMNGGSSPSDNAFMTSQDNNFPSNTTPVDISNFPAAFYEDVDHDNIKDLVVGTNVSGASENTESVLFYKNLGTDSNPNFSFIENDFLQGGMIENGKGSMPVIVDVNNDGLEDLLVANFFNYNEGSANTTRVQYYQNIGTAEEPVFQFVQDNWENFQNIGLGLRILPTFGDLDNDGDKDMIVGTQNGELFFYDNSGGTGTMNFGSIPNQLQDINADDIVVSGSASPQLFDLNKDGLLDLIIGQRNGGLIFYENVGSVNNFSFQLVTENLGGVDLSSVEYSESGGVPHFVREDDTTYLFAGNRTGTIHCYKDVDGNIDDGDGFTLISDTYGDIHTNGFSSPFITQIRNDSTYDLFVGGDLGGLWAFSAPDSSDFLNLNKSNIEEIDFTIYPNPSKTGIFNIDVENIGFDKNTIDVIDISGRRIINNQKINGSKLIDLSHKKSGIYIVLLKDEKNSVIGSRKLIVE